MQGSTITVTIDGSAVVVTSIIILIIILLVLTVILLRVVNAYKVEADNTLIHINDAVVAHNKQLHGAKELPRSEPQKGGG